jgi:DNA-binding IclR family transcriptional regulator
MKHLRELSGETVNLQIRIGAERMCLTELESFQYIKYKSGTGTVQPIYVGSAGKLLLSELTGREIRLLLDNVNLVALASNTITDRDVLLREVHKIKQRGYATSFGERIEGSASVSVPIKNYVCSVAMSILGPANRFSSKIMDIVGEMKKSANRISENFSENGKTI